MQKLYTVKDTRNGRVYTVVADSYQGACEALRIPPCDGVLLGMRPVAPQEDTGCEPYKIPNGKPSS